jgi:hypothetical protein
MFNDNNITREGIIMLSSMFPNQDRRNGGWKLSIAFVVIGRILSGNVTFGEYLPTQRRFKAEISVFPGKDQENSERACITKINALRSCLGLGKVTGSVQEVMEITRNDFVNLKNTKSVLNVLATWVENPNVAMEEIHGKTFLFNWANGIQLRPQFKDLINPQGPQQMEMF